MLRCNSIPHIDLQLLHGPFQNPSCRICRDWQADPKVRKDTRAGSSAVPGTRAELGDPHASVQRHDNHSSATLTDRYEARSRNKSCLCGLLVPPQVPSPSGERMVFTAVVLGRHPSRCRLALPHAGCPGKLGVEQH